jgi:IS5 family transposase
VDATIIEAASSTKNKAKKRDPKMHQTQKGKEACFVSADSGYRGTQKREELKDVKADWLIAEVPRKVKLLKKHPRKNKQPIKTEYIKTSIRAKVEHLFSIIKCQFGFRKAIYRGLTKNDSKLAMLFALANVFRVDPSRKGLIRLKTTKQGSIILFSGRKVINQPHY